MSFDFLVGVVFQPMSSQQDLSFEELKNAIMSLYQKFTLNIAHLLRSVNLSKAVLLLVLLPLPSVNLNKAVLLLVLLPLPSVNLNKAVLLRSVNSLLSALLLLRSLVVPCRRVDSDLPGLSVALV